MEFLDAWKKAKMKSIFRGEEEDLENCRLVSFKSSPAKVMMQILARIFEPTGGNWEHPEWIYQGHDEMTGSVQGRAEEEVYLDFSKTFDVLYYNNLTEKLVDVNCWRRLQAG